ncbi:prepro-carboxypeptidase Z [Chlamydoabsidia padenii]|nr:prepro-carboxypeptidase Z [Chlamydoabsidia padenii]
MNLKWLSSIILFSGLVESTTVFHSQWNKNHTLTFKQPKLCDPTVVQYSGYLDVGENEHYFFWFFESRQDPEHAPVVAWLNGGPGCSSMIGLWQELGPCRVTKDGHQDTYNTEGSWNQVANMLFFDQPDGVGFSYGKDNVYSTDDAAPLSYNLLQAFFEAFPKYQRNPFHFYGESYGGHYIPAFADYTLKKNLARTPQSKSVHINLQSIGIGNGYTDSLTQNQYYEKMACYSTYGSVLPASYCKLMKKNTPKCLALTKTCYKTGTNKDCTIADNYCTDHVQNIYDHANRSYYDIRTADEIPSTYITFLNKTSTRELIGAKVGYQECANTPFVKFSKTGDDARNFAPRVTHLLNHGIRVLIYAGDADYICNWYGNYAWTKKIDFKGSKAYRSSKLKPWRLAGKQVGEFQTGGNLTFAVIHGAGHEVPYYQPKVALDMLTNEIKHRHF